MCLRTAAVLLLLVLQLSHADRTNDKRSQTPEVRSRRNDSEERSSSGRRWTTSRNSPYKKIVSSYEREAPDIREASGSESMETSTQEDQDEAKAKSHKRKQWRTSAASHDQIASETSSDSEVVAEGNAPEEAEEAQRSHKSTRRRPATSHPPEPSSSTPNPKKRRRPVSTSATTTTLAPQTMSDSLYQYFRPLDQDVPQDDIIPFLDFGRKLSPVIPTPSGVNSIDSKLTVTKLRPRYNLDEKESNSSDEELLQEDMDVTVVKKAIERNSVPRGKIRVRVQGISDYYRKRAPAQVRTTENLISTSDSSTASSVPGTKNVGVLKKINRHNVHQAQPHKIEDKVPIRFSSDDETSHIPKNVEIIQENRRLLPRPLQRSAALKQESHPSPLTAESSLVKTIIKEPLVGSTTEKEQSNTPSPLSVNKNISFDSSIPSSSVPQRSVNSSDIVSSQPDTKAEANQKSKILSTAVVTSVSVQESLEDNDHHTVTDEPPEATANSTSLLQNETFTKVHQLHLPPSESNEPSDPTPTVRNSIAVKNSTNSIQSNSSTPISTIKKGSSETKTTITRNDTSLRSRDIYRPKAIPPGVSIPYLPRQIPIIRNATSKLANPSSTDSPPLLSNNETSPVPSSTIIATPVVSTTTSTTPPTTTVQTTAATKKQDNVTRKVQFTTTSFPTVLPTILSNDELYNKTKVFQTKLDRTTQPAPVVPETTTSVKEDNVSNTQTVTTEVEEEPSTVVNKSPNHNYNGNTSSQGLDVNREESSLKVDLESVPSIKNEEAIDNLTIVPMYIPDYDTEDQFPVYFTTMPSSTSPVIDTRPKTEEAVVQEQKNATTVRPGAEWVRVGAVDKEVEVVYPETLGVGAYLLAGLGVVPIILGALVGARYIMAHNKKKVLDESEYSSEYNRSPLGIATASPLPTKLPRIPTHVSWSETEKNTPTTTVTPVSSSSARWEFSRDKMRLQTLLGQGNFGQVWKAEADDISGHEGLTRLVAVKTVKESANAREREDLLRELGIMQELGSHPNVVTLLGCCTDKEPIYLIMEYVMYGKLLSFLRDHRTRAHYYNFSDATDALTSRDLTVFAYCVARGMDYLTNKSIIHRDLAARNVLVDHNKLCKIADFGMSRNVRDTGQIYEQRQSKGALPIRWMAPESLHFSLFTHKTDVWSFGILMWEIVTLGSTPYATMGAREVMRRVRDGYRLDRPSHCRTELFRVIAQCWHSEPSKRPTFAELKVELGQLLSDSELNGSYVDLDSFADEMRRDTLHRHH